jgi:hypothetical protein
MKRMTIPLALSVIVLLCGCGGAPGPTPNASAVISPTTPPVTSPPTTPVVPNIAGNWQFTTPSTTPGSLPLAFAGSLTQTGTTINAAIHIDGSNCFDRQATINFTGTMPGSGTSLTSTAINGQVITITGDFTNTGFTGTYKMDGGCASGVQGTVTGVNIPLIADNLTGTFTSSAKKTFDVTGDIAQSASASSEGSFFISGDVTFDSPCFTAARIKPGTFSSGSFILGMTVGLEFDTSNGIVTVLGTLSPDRSEIDGSYSITGGTCSDNGTVLLHVTSPWD